MVLDEGAHSVPLSPEPLVEGPSRDRKFGLLNDVFVRVESGIVRDGRTVLKLDGSVRLSDFKRRVGGFWLGCHRRAV